MDVLFGCSTLFRDSGSFTPGQGRVPTSRVVMGPLGSSSRWCNSYRSTSWCWCNRSTMQPVGAQPQCNALTPHLLCRSCTEELLYGSTRWFSSNSKSLSSSSNNGWGANNKRGRVPSPPVTKTPLLWMAVKPENVINGIKRIVSNGPFCHPIDRCSFQNMYQSCCKE